MNRDIHRLDPRLLQAFDALALDLNVTRAAARLGLTQQGLSGQLARLRELFEDPLFVRDGSGVTPTPRALALIERVRAALADLEALVERPSFDPAALSRVMTIAASDYAVATVLPGLLARIRAEAPGLRLAVRSVRSKTLESELREKQVDFALTVPEFTPEGLRSRKLFSERYVGAMREGHPDAGRPMDLECFCSRPHLLISPDKGDFHGPVDVALAAVGAKRDLMLVLPTFAVALSILETSDMFAVLPSRLALSSQKIRTFEPPVAVPGFDLCGVWPERLQHDAAHTWFRRTCYAA